MYRDSWYARWGKAALDRILGTALLVVSAPLQLGVAAVVRRELGSPVLLRQRRIGYRGRTFELLKFRTMLPDRRIAGGAAFGGSERRSGVPSPNDPRHTGLGCVLRRWSLDELPQLVNVVRGDMSLVGPRPELTEVIALYEPWQLERHAVKPGLTGVWQVQCRDQSADLRDFAEVDVAYARSPSLLTDLRVLARTPLALVRRPAPQARLDERRRGLPSGQDLDHGHRARR